MQRNTTSDGKHGMWKRSMHRGNGNGHGHPRAHKATRPHGRGRHEEHERSIDARVGELGGALRRVLGKAPYLAAGVVGVGVFALASAVGVGELAAGVGAAYAAYRMFRYGENPIQATEQAAKVGEGQHPQH
jgi:hypothetical protein